MLKQLLTDCTGACELRTANPGRPKPVQKKEVTRKNILIGSKIEKMFLLVSGVCNYFCLYLIGQWLG